MQFELTIQAAAVAGGEVSTVMYEAATADDAVKAFWDDVNAFGLCVSKVLAVRAA